MGQEKVFETPRPKFLRLTYQTLPAINALPPGEASIAANNHFEENRIIDFQISAPLILKNDFKLITQLKYKNEVLNLGGVSEDLQRTLFLKNAGLVIIAKQHLSDDQFLVGYFSGSYKSNKFYNFASILDYNASLGWGKTIDKNTELGLGIIAANTFGRFRISPVLSYEKRFSHNLLLDLKLPKRAKLTKLMSNSLYFYGEIEGSSGRYALNDQVFTGLEDLEFRRTNIDFKLGIEKEVYDWLWMEVNGGYTHPWISRLVNRGGRTRNYIHDFDQNGTAFVSFSLFMVPPRSLFNKHR